MSGDWHKGQQTPMRHEQEESNGSPFMRTAFGYSHPAQAPNHTPASAHPRSPAPQLPRLTPQPASYQTEHKNTPTSVLLPSSDTPQQLRGRLMTIKGEQRGESWFLNRSHTSLGRALDNDIVLLDIAASRKHAQIIRGDNGFVLLDLRSANGIFLNGRRVTEEDLYDGDEIEVGETVLKFETVGQARVRADVSEDDTDPGMTVIPEHLSQPVFSAPPPLPNLPSHQQPIVSTHPSMPQMPAQSHQNRQASQQASRQASHQYSPSTQSTRASGRKKNHLTYGFGSQLSPEELNLSSLTQGSSANQQTWPEYLLDEAQKLKVELTLGRGHKAQILRISAILSVMILFFVLGQGLNHVLADDIGSEPSPQVVDRSVRSEEAIQTSKDVDSSSTLIDQNRVQDLSRLIALKEWSQALDLIQKLSQNSSQNLVDPRLLSFRNQAEQGLIIQKSPLISTAIHKGTLGKAQQLFDHLQKQISNEGQVALASLNYTLWLHKNRLGDLSQFNPPPREQRALAKAAQEQISGNYRQAQKTLKRARPSKVRKALFDLRIKSVNAQKKLGGKQKTELSIAEIELSSLLTASIDTQPLIQHYKTEIEKGVLKTQYKQIAPWLEAVIILSVNQPLQQYFIKRQQKLKAEAIKWLSIANASQNQNNIGLKRALLESALPYLEGQNLVNAQTLMKQIR